jgi:four helix bundle protein
MAAAGPKYDLEDRTARFGEGTIRFAKTVRSDCVAQPIISQLVRLACSVGANYCEADDAGSRKDFLYRINICKKEARETKHWLRMIAVAAPACHELARPLWQEAKELHLIFAKISRSTAKGHE